MNNALRSAALVSAALLFMPGCSKSLDKGSGVDVTGTVRLDGKPLEIGMIIVMPSSDMAKENQATFQLTSSGDGKYSVTGAPLGSVKIVVMTRQLKGMMTAMANAKGPGAKGGAPAGPSGKFIDVPDIYQDPNTTTLTTNLVKGQNSFDIEMKSK